MSQTNAKVNKSFCIAAALGLEWIAGVDEATDSVDLIFLQVEAKGSVASVHRRTRVNFQVLC